MSERKKNCYQCDEPVFYLFADGRCSLCTRVEPIEVHGEQERPWEVES